MEGHIEKTGGLMKLYLKTPDGKKHFICETESKEDIWKEIRYRTQNCLRPVYTHIWTENNGVWMNYGGQNEFFIIEGG